MRLIKQPAFLLFMIVASAHLFSAPAAYSATNRWDYAETPQEQIEFLDKNMPSFLDLRKTQGDEAALKELGQIWKKAIKEGFGTYYLHRAIWYEAQANGGKEDQAWGLALYEFLYDITIENNPDRNASQTLSANEYILCGNMIECCLSLGKAALAREYCSKVEESLKSDLHFDLSGKSYADRGPIFSFTEEARKRDYPIFTHEMEPENADSSERDFFYYPTLYGVGYVAEAAMRAGDWKKAAELSMWCIRYADEYLRDQSLMKAEVNIVCSYGSRKMLSEIALLHGYPREAARILKEYIALSEDYYNTDRWDLLRAKLDLATVQIQTGSLTDEALSLADEAAEAIAGNWYYSRATNLLGTMDKARVYHALGHKQEAWKMIEDVLAQSAANGSPHLRIRMLEAAIDLAMKDGGSRPELEEWLNAALGRARRTGDKSAQIPLYEKQALFLFMKGRIAEAITAQQEAVKLSQSLNLPKRLADNEAFLATLEKQR